MKGVFIELPPFERRRQDYRVNPLAGDVIEGTGGLRKIRYRDSRRSKGKRGGLRVIYYWWLNGSQFWLFTVYDKDEVTDLTATEKKALKVLLESEVAARSK